MNDMIIDFLLKENKAKIKYEGIIELYPRRFDSYLVLNKTLTELSKNYNLVKITDNWIRCFKK